MDKKNFISKKKEFSRFSSGSAPLTGPVRKNNLFIFKRQDRLTPLGKPDKTLKMGIGVQRTTTSELPPQFPILNILVGQVVH